MTPTIYINRDTLVPDVSPDAKKLRGEAIAEASLIKRVTTAAENQDAQLVVNQLHALRKACADSHKEAKAPYLVVCQETDRIKREFVTLLETEETRICRMQGDWLAAEQARVRAEAALRQKELDAVEREKQERIAGAKTVEEVEDIKTEYSEANKGVIIAMPQTAAGQTVREDWDIQIADIAELYKACPQAVELTPRMSKIREALDLGYNLPGVIAKRVPKSGARKVKR